VRELPRSGPQGVPAESTLPPVRQILVPDACVGVKWCVPELDSDGAARLLDARFELHSPSYFFTETASVLQRKVAVDRTLSEAEGLDAFRLLQMIPMTVHATEGLLEEGLFLRPISSAAPKSARLRHDLQFSSGSPGDRNPIRRFFCSGVGGAINCRIASKTTRNCASYFFSRASSLRASPSCEASNCRSRTNALMISMFTSTARSLWRTLDSIATPCSVKA